MSRIADVLQKSRDARVRRFPSPKGSDGEELSLRSVGDVGIPWQLDDDAASGKGNGEGTATTPPVAAAPVASPIVPDAPPVRQVEHVKFAPDEETLALARRLFLSDLAGPRHVVFGSVDAAGTSKMLALELAVALAREAKGSVCLVDLDLGGGTLHAALQLNAAPGFSDVIVRGTPVEECVQQVGSETALSFIAAGSSADKLRATLAERRTLSSIHAVLQGFDYVVAVAAPGVPDDLTAMGSCFDGAVLVLDAATTTGDATRAVAEMLRDAGVPLIGSVLRRSAPAAT